MGIGNVPGPSTISFLTRLSGRRGNIFRRDSVISAIEEALKKQSRPRDQGRL
jgi:hypothetical protein